ncbi:MAG: hypothetical protein GY930_09955 [bacterium]|nr:hypothetical protein [bacterium]
MISPSKNALLIAFSMICMVACKDSSSVEVTPPALDLPEDTVLLVEGLPITRTDIDRWLSTYAPLEPAKSKHAIRRYIMTNHSLPVTVGALADPEGRAQARKRLEATLKALKNGDEAPTEGPQVQRIHGSFKDRMGLDRWGVAKETPKGEWSEVFETVGGFTAVRLLGAPDPWLPNSEITIEHITEDYIPEEESREFVEQALTEVHIQVIDPEWGRYLPTLYLHNSKLPK